MLSDRYAMLSEMFRHPGFIYNTGGFPQGLLSSVILNRNAYEIFFFDIATTILYSHIGACVVSHVPVMYGYTVVSL